MATPAERAGWLFFLFPLAGLALTNPVTHASPPRYFLGMLPGVAVALACLIWRATNAVIHMRKVNLVAMGILTLFATVGIARQIKTMRAPELIDPYGQLGQTREFLKLEENLVWQDGREFIVWNGPGLYLTAKQYSKFSERYIFLRPDDEHERAQVWNRILDWAEYAPVKIWPMKDLAAQIGRAAVVEPMPSTVAAMQKMGFEVSIRYTRPVRIVYFIPSTKRQLLRSAT